MLLTKDLGNVSTVISCSGSDRSSSEGMRLLACSNGKDISFCPHRNHMLRFFLSIACGRRMKCFCLFFNSQWESRFAACLSAAVMLVFLKQQRKGCDHFSMQSN